jgi:hypothetical protein
MAVQVAGQELKVEKKRHVWRRFMVSAVASGLRPFEKEAFLAKHSYSSIC